MFQRNTTRVSQRRPYIVAVFTTVIVLLLGTRTDAAKPVVAPKPNHKLFLWKVESKTTTIYLLGSVHAAKKSLYPLPAVIYEAFDRSDKLVLEMPMDFASQVQAGIKMLTAAQLPKGDKLDKHLDAETRKLLAAYAQKSKFPAAGLQSYRPWMAAMMITQIELPRHGYSMATGIDQHFVARARRKRKPMLGLETSEDQVAVFASMPAKSQLNFLKQTLKDTGKIGETMDAMFDAWKRGDAKGLDNLTLDEFRKDKDKYLFNALIVKRNNAWMKKIAKFLDGKTKYFIVVGAGHLLGKEGLIEQLQATGKYRIKQY